MASSCKALFYGGALPLAPVVPPLAGSRVSAGFTNPADDFREEPPNLVE